MTRHSRDLRSQATQAADTRDTTRVEGSDKRRVLVIEDEPDMVRGLRDAMTFEGFDVLSANSGREGVDKQRETPAHLVILDLMLPDINGFKVCEEIRQFDQHVPVLMLTARSQEADKIRGFEVGADDYVTKPFSIGELLARINAMFRRLDLAATPAAQLRIGECEIDFKKQTVTRNQRAEVLSFYEVELLRLLCERVGEPVSRDEILEKIWGLEAAPTNRTVDNFIVKLRRKLERDPKNPRHILTVYGFGYKLVSD
ncbi:MAG: response regulator transcription factor [Myxococcales bacterium]|nr:response regulator transcription factor [Myxococcales bacterium]